MDNTQKAFFTPGDIVTLKQEIPNKPKMVVKSIDKLTLRGDKPSLFGITCFWFTTEGQIQSERFSTKDLLFVEDE